MRVSPRPQDKVRYSPQLQESKCREWCLQNGHDVVTVVQDILVSGGAANRFDSIFAALDATPFDIAIVSDLSRWTRDDPERFWYIKHVLTERGVRLYSVDEPWLGSDIPFSATITTAVVDSNNQQRIVSNKKTSAGIRAAKASGKNWWKHFGWTWDPVLRRYDKDAERITEVYRAWVRGDTAEQMGRRFGMDGSHVKRTIAAEGQRAVVGDELWLQAQARLPGRGPRSDAKRGNVYRGLLVCPFCGSNIQRHSSIKQPFNYGCMAGKHNGVAHDWRFLDVRLYVTPPVQDALSRLVVPESEIVLAQPNTDRVNSVQERNYAAEIERLTMAWVRGRIPDERYERAVVALEAERDRPVPPPPPVEVQVEIARFAEQLDLTTQDIDEANALNRVLREALTIEVGSDRYAAVQIREPYLTWAR